MTQLEKMIQRETKILGILLLLYVLLIIITPNKELFSSLALGTFFGIANLWASAKFIIGLINSLAGSAKKSTKKRTIALAFRVVLVFCPFAITWFFPNLFSILFVFIGFVTSYFVMMIDYGFSLFYKKT